MMDESNIKRNPLKIVIDLDVTPEDFKRIQVFNIKMMNNKITHKIYEAVQKGEPLSNSDVIISASEKGEIYKRGFEDARKRFERPTGELIKDEDGSIICSICETGTSIKSIPSVIFFRYCPYCGAELKRGNEVKNETD